jgi:hypothetical protein
MMGQLDRRAEATSGEFSSQEVANTLWAFATMGTKPGERMMGQLDRRVEAISGEFSSQGGCKHAERHAQVVKEVKRRDDHDKIQAREMVQK